MKKTFTVVLSIIVACSYGQESETQREFDLDKLAEELFQVQDLDLDYSELYENLLQLLSSPLDLNKASADQFRSVYVLSETQLSDLLDYREQFGPLLSVYELQVIPTFDAETLSRFLPFVSVSERKTDPLLRRVLREENKYIILRYQRTLEEKRGFHAGDQGPSYSGNADQYYMRIRISHPSDFSVGITAEKDAGETFEWSRDNNYYGFDYYSFHGQVTNRRFLKNLVVGDFQAQFGQGLVLGGGFGVGKGSETITTVRRSNTGFTPYTSLNESGFFRGLAATIEPLRYVSLGVFASYKKRDASVDADTINQTGSISSLNSSGLHRTESEISNRNSIDELNTGIAIGFQKSRLSLGVVSHFTIFSLPVNPKPSLYNQFSFNSQQLFNTGLNFSYSVKNLNFFSEVAKTQGEGTATVAGTLISLTSRLDLAMVYRDYARNYQSLYANAFSEATVPQNENGFYWGWKYKFSSKYLLTGYMDFFRFEWLRYRVYSPSTGSEWLLRFNYQPTKKILFTMQMREEIKARNVGEGVNYTISSGTKKNYVLNAEYEASDALSFKTRAQFSSFSFAQKFSGGFALVQDVTMKFKKFSLSTRYALFDTDDYDNRQYVYEKDVWLAYSFPAYYGLGTRCYVNMRYKISKKIDLWLRWAQTYSANQTTIGSGMETIMGDRKNDVKFQLVLKP